VQKPRTRKGMIAYLGKHSRYDTMRSWNRGTSFSRNIKITRIPFSDQETRLRAFDLLNVDEALEEFDWIIHEFDLRHDYAWQIGRNGRSGGYLVLYSGGKKDTGYKSYCPSCGQRNYKQVPSWGEQPETPEEKLRTYFRSHRHWRDEVYLEQSEVKAIGLDEDLTLEIIREERKLGDVYSTTNKCGVCGNPRVNYTSPVYESYLDTERVGESCPEDYTDWETSSLKNLVDVVWDFDKTVDKAIRSFIAFCEEHEAVDDFVLVKKPIKVAVPLTKAAA
jgi:hypothetical protein